MLTLYGLLGLPERGRGRAYDLPSADRLALIGRWPGLMAGPFAPFGRRVAARRRTPGGLGPRARPRPRCGLGLGAALRAGLTARASAQPSPHAARAAGYCWRQGRGVPALRAGGGSRPRPLGASLPPPAACGPLPLPTLGGWGAARPARLRRSGLCGGWSPPAAAQVCAPAGLASRQPLRGGTPPQRKAKPLRGRLRRALRCSSPAPVAASVLRRGPAPTLWGLWGRPRLRPGRARLRPAAPRWPACGSARAGAALPPLGPPGVAAPPRCGVPPPSRGAASAPLRVAARARPQFLRRAQGPCPLCGSRPCPALRARLGRGVTPPAGGTATPEHIRQGQDKPPAAGLA